MFESRSPKTNLSAAQSARAAERAMFAPRPFFADDPDWDSGTLDTTSKPVQARLNPMDVNFCTMPLHAPGRSSLPVQPKLTIGQPGDKYEQEADRMASQVMQMPDSPDGSQPILQLLRSRLPMQREMKPEEEKEIQTKPLAASITPLVQREIRPEDENETVQTKPITEAAQANPDLESQLNASEGGGSPLSDEVRSFMEPRFGADFSQVKVHTDSQSVQMNQALGAQAFTHGSDVYFGSGKSPANNDLTAHELTHVVQQTGRTQRKCANCEEIVKKDEDLSKQNTLHTSHVQEFTYQEDRVQRVHIENGRKKFDNPDYIGDSKLENCLNDEDRLRPFETGSSVIRVQQGLQKDGENLGKDGTKGIYGADTGKAVIAFKKKYNLGFTQFPDVGPGTMTKLDELGNVFEVPPQASPPNPVQKCFDSIEWEAFFEQANPGCESLNQAIELTCGFSATGLGAFTTFFCSEIQKKSPSERTEDCVTDAGFGVLVQECGIPTSPPGKAEIRERYHKWASTQQPIQKKITSEESRPKALENSITQSETAENRQLLPTSEITDAPTSIIQRVEGSCKDVPARIPHHLIVRGSVHPDVREAQRKLNQFHQQEQAAGRPGLPNASLIEDCTFGQNTFSATLAFQQQQFPEQPQEQDGKIGDHTWAALDKVGFSNPPPISDGSCSVGGEFLEIPSGNLTAKMDGIRLGASFSMIGQFTTLKEDCASCANGEYRQFVRGTFKKNGKDLTKELCGGTLDLNNFQEDCVVIDGQQVNFGHRSLTTLPTLSRFIEPDQTTGCKFIGHDEPGVRGKSGDKLGMDLEFRGELVDTSTGNIIDFSQWSVFGAGEVP